MIELRNVFKSYRYKGQNRQVLNNINLRIEKGEKVAVMGKNGSGKTTLLNLIAAVDTPDEGEYLFKGQNLPVNKPVLLNSVRRSSFGYIPQASCLIREKSGFYNISLPLFFRGYSKAEIKEKVDEAASLLNIIHLLDKRPDEMSSGECQKIAIARALISNPEVILADEMTNTLDEESKNTVLSLVKNSKEMTAVIVTHDKSVATTCDKILYLYEGAIQMNPYSYME